MKTNIGWVPYCVSSKDPEDWGLWRHEITVRGMTEQEANTQFSLLAMIEEDKEHQFKALPVFVDIPEKTR